MQILLTGTKGGRSWPDKKEALFTELYPEEPSEHEGACKHNAGWNLGVWLNCCVCGYRILEERRSL